VSPNNTVKLRTWLLVTNAVTPNGVRPSISMRVDARVQGAPLYDAMNNNPNAPPLLRGRDVITCSTGLLVVLMGDFKC